MNIHKITLPSKRVVYICDRCLNGNHTNHVHSNEADVCTHTGTIGANNIASCLCSLLDKELQAYIKCRRSRVR